jgi:hypothetical protein
MVAGFALARLALRAGRLLPKALRGGRKSGRDVARRRSHAGRRDVTSGNSRCDDAGMGTAGSPSGGTGLASVKKESPDAAR